MKEETLQDNPFMGQVNISTRGKYVHLGKSLLIQFLISSDSPGESNIENPKDLNRWLNIT